MQNCTNYYKAILENKTVTEWMKCQGARCEFRVYRCPGPQGPPGPSSPLHEVNSLVRTFPEFLFLASETGTTEQNENVNSPQLTFVTADQNEAKGQITNKTKYLFI